MSERVDQLFTHRRCGRMSGRKIRSRILERRMARDRYPTLTDELVRTRTDANKKAPPKESAGLFVLLGYIFSTGAILTFIFLIPLFAPENAISAMSSLSDTTTPSPNCAWRMRQPRWKSEGSCLTA